MALTFYWNCELTDFSSDNAYDSPFTQANYSVGDDTATAAASATIDASAARSGTYGILSNANGKYFSFSNNAPAIVDPDVGCVAFSIYLASLPGFGANIGFAIQGIDADNAIKTLINNSGYVTLRIESDNGASPLDQDIATSTTALTTGAWYGIVIRWDQPGSRRSLEIYTAAGAPHDSVSSSEAFVAPEELGGTAAMKFGNMASVSNTMYFDNCFVGSAYDDPLQNNLAISSYQSYSASTTTKYLKMLVHTDAIGATGVEGVVWAASTDSPGARVGAEIGEFSGGSFTDGGGSPQTDPGYAVLKVAVDDFGGSALTTSDTPIAVARTSTYTTGLVSCTVVEE